MTKNRNPAAVGTADGAGSVDLAGKLVERPYRSETLTRKAPSLFDQLVRLAYDFRMFEHAYGKRPPGKGWWSPIDEGEHHHVRYIGRRRRR